MFDVSKLTVKTKLYDLWNAECIVKESWGWWLKSVSHGPWKYKTTECLAVSNVKKRDGIIELPISWSVIRSWVPIVGPIGNYNTVKGLSLQNFLWRYEPGDKWQKAVYGRVVRWSELNLRRRKAFANNILTYSQAQDCAPREVAYEIEAEDNVSRWNETVLWCKNNR